MLHCIAPSDRVLFVFRDGAHIALSSFLRFVSDSPRRSCVPLLGLLSTLVGVDHGQKGQCCFFVAVLALFSEALSQRLEAMSGSEDNAAAQREVAEDETMETASASQGSAASSSTSADPTHPLPEPGAGKSTLLDRINERRRNQLELKMQRKQVAKDMKLAVKKKKRLQARANQLSDGDLLEVIKMRAETKKRPTGQ